jgi:hypothetical protein
MVKQAMVHRGAIVAAVAVIAVGLLASPVSAHGTCDDHEFQVRRGESGYSSAHDRDGDGIGCESLPARPSTPPPPLPTPPAPPAPPTAPPAPTPPVCNQHGAAAPPAPTVGAAYWMLEQTGTIYGFGDSSRLNPVVCESVVSIDGSPGGRYWILASDGTVYAAGGAANLGNVNLATLGAGEHVASISGRPDGLGYWVFTNRGRAIPFGSATNLGGMQNTPLNGPIVASVATPTGAGYYMVGSDGGIFSFGDAAFWGSTGEMHLNEPVVGIAPDPDGAGYWLVGSDGGIFAFNAGFRGSVPGVLGATGHLNRPVIGAIAYGDGYLMVASDGGIFSFSDKPFLGSLGANPPANPIVAVATWDPAFVASSGLGRLSVASEQEAATYDRDTWRHWTDADGDCQDTRDEVLAAESIVAVTWSISGCDVTAGQWLDPYTGTTFTTPSGLDIDHMVPLAEAHRTGGWAWDGERREQYANDMGDPSSLVAVSASANRSKSDQSPDEWRPPLTSSWCVYATDWITVKLRWELTVTPAERDALAGMLTAC